MSDTPETNAQQLVHSVNGAELHCVDIEFARNMERDRNNARRMAESLRAAAYGAYGTFKLPWEINE